MGLRLSFWDLFLSVKVFYIHLPRTFILNFKLPLVIYKLLLTYITPEYMLGTSKRNLLSASYAMLVITEMSVETLGTGRGPVCRHRSSVWPRSSMTQQHLVLLGFLQIAIPQRLVETHDRFKINPTGQD